MSTDKLLNDVEVSELKQKNDLINVFTLMSMWAQVILAFGLFILFPNPLTFFISAIIEIPFDSKDFIKSLGLKIA